MQTPRPNAERREATRNALLDAARELFVAQGYGATATPAVCASAGLTRGALYHHFNDKRDLFQAVLMREAEAVAADITAAAPTSLAPDEALMAGTNAYLDAMARPGRTRLLLIEGPAALGSEKARALDGPHAQATLKAGLEHAGVQGVDLDMLTHCLSAAFDRAALEMQLGADRQVVRSTLHWLLQRLLAPPTQ